MLLKSPHFGPLCCWPHHSGRNEPRGLSCSLNLSLWFAFPRHVQSASKKPWLLLLVCLDGNKLQDWVQACPGVVAEWSRDFWAACNSTLFIHLNLWFDVTWKPGRCVLRFPSTTIMFNSSNWQNTDYHVVIPRHLYFLSLFTLGKDGTMYCFVTYIHSVGLG